MKQKRFMTITTVRRDAFTIIELLLVIVISSIMMGMFIPQFDKMLAGSKIDAGAKLVAGQLSLAHQFAQTSGNYVALLMPGSETVGLTEEYMYSVCRLAYLTDGTTLAFDSWIPNSKWLFMPMSCSIMEVDGDTGIKGYDSGTSTKFYSKYPEENNVTYATNVLIGEPLVVGASAFTAAQVRAVIFKPSGRLKQATPSHRYITVGEAEYFASMPNDWVIVNAGAATDPDKFKSCANQVTIKVNGYTGGVKYFTVDKLSLDPEDEE